MLLRVVLVLIGVETLVLETVVVASPERLAVFRVASVLTVALAVRVDAVLFYTRVALV